MNAWSKLYQDNFERIYRHVRALTGDPHVSEELVQETFVQALLRISSFDGRSTFSTWLHGVAINVVRNHWRSQKSTAKAHARLEVVRSMDAPGDEPGVAVHRQQRVRALYAALETLPDPLRVAFVLRDLEGLSPEEAAARLGDLARQRRRPGDPRPPADPQAADHLGRPRRRRGGRPMNPRDLSPEPDAANRPSSTTPATSSPTRSAASCETSAPTSPPSSRPPTPATRSASPGPRSTRPSPSRPWSCSPARARSACPPAATPSSPPC